MHLYVHSVKHDPSMPIPIPASISIPLVAVSRELGLPPILTYADTVLWNWKLNHPPPALMSSNEGRRKSFSAPLPNSKPSTDISTRTSFTGTPDEAHFYITSAKIELRGVEALTLMRRTLDETFLSDTLAARRVTNYLTRLAKVIDDITILIQNVRTDCDPATFYHKIRPWFHGASAHKGQGWEFEGVALSEAEQDAWGVLSGPSAGQSSLVHALDVFLGVDHTKPAHGHSHGHGQPNPHVNLMATASKYHPPYPPKSSVPASKSAANPSKSPDATFLQRMQQYMPRHHRAFLQYLGTVENPVRAFVLNSASTYVPPIPQPTFSDEPPSPASVSDEPPLTKAYNTTVDALKRFRDAHIRVATLYIVTASRLSPGEAYTLSRNDEGEDRWARATGTGGTELVPFLKGARDNTLKTALR